MYLIENSYPDLSLNIKIIFYQGAPTREGNFNIIETENEEY